jgi:hypothetical protein
LQHRMDCNSMANYSCFKGAVGFRRDPFLAAKERFIYTKIDLFHNVTQY